MSLAGWIGVGAGAGLALGLVVGENCTILAPVGKAYVMLLQSVVYPYLISSLVHGLGRLSPQMALRLLRKSWPFYLVAWGGVLGIIYLLSQAFPPTPPPIVIDAAQAARSGPDFLQLILPGNIFHDLASNYVPAVVMLSVLFGVALQGVPGKDKFLDILALIRTACVKIWNWVVKLAPAAVLAMVAVTAGTTELAKAGGLAVYVFLFLAVCGLLAFWAIPVLISSMIPVRYREVLGLLRDGLILSLVTTLSVVALPFIQKAAEKLARENQVDDPEHSGVIETCLAVNYPLGQLGNFFVFFFILFTAFYTRTPLTGVEQASLPLMTLFSCFGSPSSTVNAVDFLSSWLHLPGRPTTLYVETMTITRYGQVALSVMGFAFLTFLMTFSYYGKLKIRPGRLAVCSGVLLVAVAALAWGGRSVLVEVLNKPQETYLNFTIPAEQTRGVTAKFYRTRDEFLNDHSDAALAPGESVLARVQRTQTLRVGYAYCIPPFGYTNKYGQLVGYDIACAYGLARSLNVNLEFVPVVFGKIKEDVQAGIMDMWAGGVYVMESRMLFGAFSKPYYQSPLALIVPSGQVEQYMTMDQIRKNPDFRIAILNNPTLRTLAGRLFPEHKPVSVPEYDALPGIEGWSAALWTLEQAGVWCSSHPGYSAVRPADMGAVAVFAYFLNKNSDEMIQFINHWLDMRNADGFLARQREHWITRSIPGAGR